MNDKILNEILDKDNFSRDELKSLLELGEKHQVEMLFNRADLLRKNYFGDEIHLRGVIEISNYCRKNCNYCGLRDENYTIKRYRMEPDEIIEIASQIAKLGIYTIVLKSGEDEKLDLDFISYLIYSIKSHTNLAIMLSLGERGFDEYKSWKIAGADRYILRHETCDKKKYSLYTNKQSFINRVQHLKYLKRLGYQVGTGSLIGLPLQTIDDIIDDILLMKQLDVDIASFAPFIPTPHTPYENRPAGDVLTTLKAIAVARLVLKNTHIPATTSLDSLDFEGREKGLNCGANVVMPDFTPQPYREKYLLYPQRRYSESDPISSHRNLRQRIEKLGRQISFSRGDSLKNSVNI